ncbi:HAD family hydrolase [Chitinophaga caeni]|nr:HAD family hydrolase [Chitinophaga caeni]
MNMDSVKLVVTDMDGTLLNANGQKSPEFYTVFRDLRKHDIQFAAASGRQYYNLLHQFEPVKNDMYFMAENGSYVAYKDETLLVRGLETTVAHGLIDIARSIPGAYIILCGRKQAYLESTDEAFLVHVNQYYDRQQIVKDLKSVVDDDLLKIAICDTKGAESNSYQHFKQYEQELQVKISGKTWLDLSDRLANKGVALSALQKRLGIRPEETMVFGDYLNDLEMMGAAKFSYAMANAHPEIKAAATYIAPSNEEDGVMTVLKELLRSKSN